MEAIGKWMRRHPEGLDDLEGFASVGDVYPAPVDLRRIKPPLGPDDGTPPKSGPHLHLRYAEDSNNLHDESGCPIALVHRLRQKVHLLSARCPS